MKTALVTGGSGEIGAAICESLAQAGYFVWVHYHKGKEKATLLASQIGGQAIEANLALASDIAHMFDTTGPLDALVNNAGISQYGLFTHVKQEDLENIVAINLTAAMLCSQRALPAMIQNKKGAIVNISSIWGQVGASCEVAYSATKAGLIGFTKALAKEVAPSSIRVNCIAPGVIQSPMLNNFSAQDLKELEGHIPLGRIGKAEEVAQAVTFLLSEQASYITGETLGVNGGGL